MAQEDDAPVTMFAESGERNFYIPINFSDSLNLLWENDVHGSFNNSSFIFFDSTVFVHDLSGRIHSFNIFTGKQTGVLKYKGAIFSTPILFNNTIVTALVLNNENKTELIFYNYFKGKELKLVDIEGRVINQMIKIYDDLILVTEEGSIKKINSQGTEVWNTKIESFTHSNPAYSNGRIYLGTDDGEFICLDNETSSVIYKKKMGTSFNSGVTIKNNFAFMGDDNGTLYKISTMDGELKWKFETGSKIIMNPALDNENVYIGTLSGQLFSIDQKSDKLIWKEKFNGAVFNSAPLITDNRIIISDLFKSVLIIDKTNGKLKSKIELDARVKMTPAIRNNILF
ncbi:MAG: PQQ-binding-like beta-propeller repeat protein, partial [Ignavibacteriaceae bacterium]|nr:PQQ-binding-like beta-propeller repeat protein [Ignavibacteriaceae bacterium]